MDVKHSEKFLTSLFDAISPSDVFFMKKLTIVNPYPTLDFFKIIHEKIKPQEIVLFVDDGYSEKAVEEIEKYFYRKHCNFSYYRVKPTKGNGLVHAKIYFLEWINEAGNHKRARLLLGSANASAQGFGHHAETFINAELSTERSKNVIEYFDYLLKNGVSQKKLRLSFNEVNIWLPKIELVYSESTSQFDAWIRRGRLCHKYEKDQRFGKLRLSLKKSLSKDALEEIFADDGFGNVYESNILYKSYIVIQPDDDGEEDQNSTNWRGQFFVETKYGFWTSEKCFEDNQKLFISKNADNRKKTIDEVLQAESEKNVWISDYISSIKNILRKLESKDLHIEDYFEVKNGYLNEEHYRKIANDKIEQDYRIAKTDNVFCERYISGYSFINVPKMEDEFDDFATSFCDSLLSKNKKTTKNKMVQKFSELEIFDDLEDKTGECLREWLQIQENWYNVNEGITNYYV